jgi:hypothetical protein
VNPSLTTVFLNALSPFLIGERINVTVRSSLRGNGGEKFEGFNWRFSIKPTKVTPPHFPELRVFGEFGGDYYSTMFPADVNNDYYIDIVILSSPIQIAMNDGLGNFSLDQQLPNFPENPDIPITDLDLDGFKEIVCSAGIYEADASGSFQFVQAVENGVYDVADMNGDAYQDLIMGDFIGENGILIGISYNDGTGHFSGMDTILVDSLIIDAVAGDFNNDGINDIAYGTGKFATPGGTGGRNSVVVAFMDSKGDTIYRSIHLSSTPLHILSLDVNNDNFLDVFNSAGISDSFFIFNDQQGGFIDSAIVMGPGGEGYSWSFFGDLTGDGWFDQLYIHESFLLDGGICRYNINMGGSFASVWGEDLEERYNVLPFIVTAGDFNGDGSQDVATIWSDGLRIHLNDNEVSIPPVQNTSPAQFILNQNYPNPFNVETVIEFVLPREQNVKIEVFDISGQKVKTLIDKMMDAGLYHINWNGQNDDGNQVGSGVYIYRMNAGGYESSNKMVLLR